MCLHCGAPHNYLYDNNGARSQLKCKVCNLNINKNLSLKLLYALIVSYSPKIKILKFFYIHKCINMIYSFYINSIDKLSLEDLENFKENKHKYKLHYIYREFTIVFSK